MQCHLWQAEKMFGSATVMNTYLKGWKVIEKQ